MLWKNNTTENEPKVLSEKKNHKSYVQNNYSFKSMYILKRKQCLLTYSHSMYTKKKVMYLKVKVFSFQMVR